MYEEAVRRIAEQNILDFTEPNLLVDSYRRLTNDQFDLLSVMMRHPDFWMQPNAKHRAIHEAVALFFLGRFRPILDAEILEPCPTLLLDIVEVYRLGLQEYSLNELLASPVHDLENHAQLNDYVGGDHTSIGPDLFKMIEEQASIDELRNLLWDENLADLNFANLILMLFYTPSGSAGRELYANLSDELSDGDETRFHWNLRADLMSRMGCGEKDQFWSISTYPAPAIIHFNVYCINGFYRQNALRAIGMLFATEKLVPEATDKVVAAWKRFGFAESDLEYFLLHSECDEAHAEGWYDGLVKPLSAKGSAFFAEIKLGTFQHLHFIEKLYEFQVSRLNT